MRNPILFFIVVFLASCTKKQSSTPNASGTITTVAGNGTQGYSGDGGPATAAQLSSPAGIALDGNGNLYIVDMVSACIRKVGPTGIISTIAGIAGHNGDHVTGVGATAAELSQPYGIAVDGSNNIYIADTYNDRICKIDPSGNMTTIAGISEVGGYSGDGGPATNAELKNPRGVVIDGSGNIYIADVDNNCVRRVTSSGIISTIAGPGTGVFGAYSGPATGATLMSPNDIILDGNGNLYIVDNNYIWKVNSSGIISVIAGNGTEGYGGDSGPATAAQMAHPTGLAVDGDGNLYIADNGNNRIRKINPSGVISTIAGTGVQNYNGDGRTAISAELSSPYSVVIDGSGHVYIADMANLRIRKINK